MKTHNYIICCIFFVMILNPQGTLSAATNGTGGTLTVNTTTSRAGGPLSLKNNVVIYIEDADGKLVNTMLYNTKNLSSSATDLVHWYSLIGTWVNRTISSNIDVITGATNKSYGLKTCYWGKKADISSAPDGVYTVRMELVDVETDEGEISYQKAAYAFVKGPTPATGTLVDTASISFLNTSISWVPLATSGIDKVELSKLYTIYPNPAKTNIFVDGLDIQQVEILTMEGKSVLKSNQQKINLTGLPNGKYMVRISTPQGELVKMMVKNP